VVKEVVIKEKLKKHIYDNAMWLGDGFEIKNIEKDYPGIIFFYFDNKDEMLQIIDNIEQYVELIYE
jgi:hypothetical protein